MLFTMLKLRSSQDIKKTHFMTTFFKKIFFKNAKKRAKKRAKMAVFSKNGRLWPEHRITVK